MSTRRRTGMRVTPGLSHVHLENRLVLLAWLNQLFGFQTNQELLADASQAEEGFNADGRSHIGVRLEARKGIQVPPAALASYDENIREHLRGINARRSTPITLRYFQHLAALYTEAYLDWFFHRQGALMDSLNAFMLRRSSAQRGVPHNAAFTRADLRKLAFWMATGSGKTLLLHLNYRQFLHYNIKSLDNILLITPNEGLSEQHMAEMDISGIPCRRFDLQESGLYTGESDAVRVIEITKLVEQKRGMGLSVPVEAFEGNNLIFVDEGHKGSGGERWRGYRDALGETGFTFEYSATFGQALTAARNDELTEEYGKSIAFDYSYRYFHGDGFGKDFNILNLKEEGTDEDTDRLLLGNLLAFYEQKRIFAEQAEALRPYNLDRPLWVFVGGTVNAVFNRNKRKQSDVLTVVRFLHRVLCNPRGWVVNTVDRLLVGESGLLRTDGRDVFDGKFRHLCETGLSPQSIYQDILAKVLHTTTGDVLQLGFVRGGSGEIGMKAGGARDYFGVIYIGDTSSFRKLVTEREPEVVVQDEAMLRSLFDGINEPNTTIEVLIGARKFMEGWNSWRVSGMGLLNVGRKEGAQVIQLFGRGVRLRGQGMSLKRSSALPGTHPDHVGLLETLNIFAVRADYMAQFRSYLEREDLHTEGNLELPLAVRPNKAFLEQRLLVPRVLEDRAFTDEDEIVLTPEADFEVQVDRSLKAHSFESQGDAFVGVAAQAGHSRRIPPESLVLVDWQQVYLELLEHRWRRGFGNLAFGPETARVIVETAAPPCYELIADDNLVAPRTIADVRRLQEAVATIVKKYADKFYRARQERWASAHMGYAEVRESDENFQGYMVRVPLDERQLLVAIEELIEEGKRIYEQDTIELPNVHFDRHLYQPLLVQKHATVETRPPALNDGERRFVEDLRTYCRQQTDGSLANKELFLLRNQGRGRGVGFFEQRGFFPDFILWIKAGRDQRIVFVEPHGMLHAGAYRHDDKARLHEFLRQLATRLAASEPHRGIKLDSYIVSATAYEDLKPKYDDGNWDRERFTQAHILFPERNMEYDYLAHMISDP